MASDAGAREPQKPALTTGLSSLPLYRARAIIARADMQVCARTLRAPPRIMREHTLGARLHDMREHTLGARVGITRIPYRWCVVRTCDTYARVQFRACGIGRACANRALRDSSLRACVRTRARKRRAARDSLLRACVNVRTHVATSHMRARDGRGTGRNARDPCYARASIRPRERGGARLDSRALRVESRVRDYTAHACAIRARGIARGARFFRAQIRQDAH